MSGEMVTKSRECFTSAFGGLWYDAVYFTKLIRRSVIQRPILYLNEYRCCYDASNTQGSPAKAMFPSLRLLLDCR